MFSFLKSFLSLFQVFGIGWGHSQKVLETSGYGAKQYRVFLAVQGRAT